MPVHKDFHSMLDSMTGQYCDGETDDTKKDQDVEGYSNKTCKKALSVFYATCKEKGLDYTEPMPKEKVREHVSAILPFQILEKIVDKPLRIRGLAITAGMSRNFNIYTPEELQAFASKLVVADLTVAYPLLSTVTYGIQALPPMPEYKPVEYPPRKPVPYKEPKVGHA